MGPCYQAGRRLLPTGLGFRTPVSDGPHKRYDPIRAALRTRRDVARYASKCTPVSCSDAAHSRFATLRPPQPLQSLAVPDGPLTPEIH